MVIPHLKKIFFFKGSISILEYIYISNFSKENARKLILEQEQHYIDTLKSVYNILITAGSLLGFNHSAETKAKLSKVMSGMNHFSFDKSLFEETKALMSIAQTEKKSSVSKRVFVYSNIIPIILSHEFVFYSEAAKHFNCSTMTISRYIKSDKLF
jgi:group I intron endonuclease